MSKLIELKLALTKPELAQLETILTRNWHDGIYYGPAEPYWNRLSRIERKLQAAVREASHE